MEPAYWRTPWIEGPTYKEEYKTPSKEDDCHCFREPPSSLHRNIHVKLHGYCVLCRSKFKSYPSWHRWKGEVWEYDVLSLFNAARDCSSLPELFIDIFVYDYRPSYIFDGMTPKRLRKVGDQLQTIELNCCLNYEGYDLRRHEMRSLYCVHFACWKMVRRSYGFSFMDIYKIAELTTPILPHVLPHLFETVVPEGPLNAYISKLSPDLARVWNRMWNRLPHELVLEILKHLDVDPREQETMLNFHLLRALDTASIILDRAIERPKLTLSCQVIHANITRLSGSVITIFGRTYIRHLSLTHQNQGTDLAIPVHVDAMSGIKYVLGGYGLQAVSLVYNNGSSSAWLGDPSGGYHGVVYGKDAKLFILQDGFKVIRVGFDVADVVDSYSPLSGVRVLWKAGDKPMRQEQMWILDMKSAELSKGISNYADSRLCHRLALEIDGSYMTGITMYSNRSGITGIVVHGKRTQRIGETTGKGGEHGSYPIHLQLQDGEFLTALAFRSSGGSEPTRSPLIMTNRGRSILFGPVYREIFYMSWSIVVSGERRITDLLIDPLKVRDYEPFYSSIGVVVEGAIEELPKLLTSPMPTAMVPPEELMSRLPYDNREHWCLSTASLTDVKKLQVRRVYKSKHWLHTECEGLLIEHYDGFVEILGNWDPLDHGLIFDLYDSSDRPLEALTFHRSSDNWGCPLMFTIGDITVGDNARYERDFVWRASSGQHEIAWFFLVDGDDERCDKVMDWQKESRPLDRMRYKLEAKRLI